MFFLTILTSWLFSLDSLSAEGGLSAQRSASEAVCQHEVRSVILPHDWAITTPFDRANDLQTVTVVQNGETVATTKTGRSGGLNWIGTGWYQTSVSLTDPKDSVYTLVFDGAMSHAKVYVNNAFVGEWPYGYNAFHFDISSYLHAGDNTILVRLDNLPQSSRWYPGAGLYRKVELLRQARVHIPLWSFTINTPFVSDTLAIAQVKMDINDIKDNTTVLTTLYLDGQLVAQIEGTQGVAMIPSPQLWSCETPTLYTAVARVYDGDRLVDSLTTFFGVRKLEYVPFKGFYLNNQRTSFKGVCLHHDLGPLGIAVHKDALRHQLTLLKEMGCNAIRTSHNMPATELVELCDEMGLMLIVEAFDTWTRPKGINDYSNEFDAWCERDIENMVCHFRNHPSVVMWSIGNEVWDQVLPGGIEVAERLQNAVRLWDRTRPVTCGMDQVKQIIYNGFGAAIEVPGLNYRTGRYEEAFEHLPQKMILGSETASTVSSRDSYHFPVVIQPDALHPDHQSSGYDVEYCAWSGLPDQDFQLVDDNPWHLGQFVWTGFDYFGEPSPYDTDAWPSHSSYFGIIDIASLPKDRFYLYRSQWNKTEPTLHILPHWTWPGREGQTTPVFVYTSYPEAEVFINGKSQGKLHFASKEECSHLAQGFHLPEVSDIPEVGAFPIPEWGCAPRPDLLPRYRLMWLNTKYEPGELKVVAYDTHHQPVAEQVIRTAGKPHHLEAVWANKSEGAREIQYIALRVVDKDGNICPDADDVIQAKGSVVAAANGDPTCLYPVQPTKPAKPAKPVQLAQPVFHGQCTFIVKNGTTTFTAKGIKSVKININN